MARPGRLALFYKPMGKYYRAIYKETKDTIGIWAKLDSTLPNLYSSSIVRLAAHLPASQALGSSFELSASALFLLEPKKRKKPDQQEKQKRLTQLFYG